MASKKELGWLHASNNGPFAESHCLSLIFKCLKNKSRLNFAGILSAWYSKYFFVNIPTKKMV